MTNEKCKWGAKMSSSRGNIIFGGFYSPPLMEYGERGNLQGPLIDLSAEIAKYFQLTPIFETLSQKQLNHFDHSGIDVGIAIFQTQGRKVLGAFSHAIMRLGLQGLGMKDYGAADLEDLIEKNVRLGVKEGEFGHEFLMDKYGSDWVSKYCRVIPEESPLLSRNLLESRECDVVLGDTVTLMNYKREMAEPNWLTFTKPIAEIDACFMVRRASPLSVDDINYWLALHPSSKIYTDFTVGLQQG